MSEGKDVIRLEGIMEQGYGIAPKVVMKDKNLSIEAKAIYAYMSSFAGSGSTAFPSISLMCADLRISELRLRKHRDMLVTGGYLTIFREPGEKGKFGKNVYTLKQIIEKPYQQNTMMVKHQHGESPSWQNVSTINNSSFNNNKKTNNNSKDKDSVQSPLSNEFDEFWKLYARKSDKKKAFDKFKLQRKQYSFEHIMNGTKKYMDYCKATNTQTTYIKLPTTFLNGENFNDEYEIPVNGGNQNAQNKRNIQSRGEGRTFVEQYGYQPDF